MACSRFEYVKQYESDIPLLLNTFICIRIDGHSFHKFSSLNAWQKPNDPRALHLSNACAKAVMTAFPDISIAYGQSDEYSFIFKRQTELYNRRGYKLASLVCSTFTSHYMKLYSQFFPDAELKGFATFDSRVVLYPTVKDVLDYLSWRQADCHINNLASFSSYSV